LIKFEGVDSDEQAKVFSGLTLFVQKKYLDKVEDAEIELNYFVGFHLVDEIKGELGLITEVDQLPKMLFSSSITAATMNYLFP